MIALRIRARWGGLAKGPESLGCTVKGALHPSDPLQTRRNSERLRVLSTHGILLANCAQFVEINQLNPLGPCLQIIHTTSS